VISFGIFALAELSAVRGEHHIGSVMRLRDEHMDLGMDEVRKFWSARQVGWLIGIAFFKHCSYLVLRGDCFSLAFRRIDSMEKRLEPYLIS
jgi:hypothetical protein